MRHALMIALALCGLALAVPAPARDGTQVRVTQPWVRGTVPGQQVTGAFMTLRADRDARLVAAASPVARTVEIHEMRMDGDVMIMRAIPGIELPAGKAVALEPGGYHLMLLGLRRPLRAAEAVPLRLTFKDAAGKSFRQEVRAKARALHDAAAGPEAQGQHGHHAH